MGRSQTRTLFIFFLASFLLGSVSAPQTAEEVSIRFAEDFSGRDLAIKKIAASRDNGHIVFTVYYQSQKDRALFLLMTPGGVTYADRAGLKKGQNIVRFSVPRIDFKDARTVTLSFTDFKDEGRDANFAYLDIYEKAAMNLLGVEAKNPPQRLPGAKARAIKLVAKYDDVRWADLTQASAPLPPDLIASLWFNLGSNFGEQAEVAHSLLEKGKNPGLGVRSLHQRGITGKGIHVAVIDQNLCLNHPEFKGKVAEYKDVGCGQPPYAGSMHAPGVMSLLAGTTIGTAPEARVYFAAAPSWTADAKFEADALEWIIEVNGSLPEGSKIRVVSVSAAPSGKGSPFKKNNALWDRAVKEADRAGILVLDCTAHHGIIGPCYYDIDNPDEVSKCRVGFPGLAGEYREARKMVLAPCSFRTTAEEYTDGFPSFQYCGRGGLSWSIPYAAGVLALGWQVRPELKPEAMVKLLFDSACITPDGFKIINPVSFIDAVKKL